MADRLSIYKGALRLLGPSELAALTDVRPERHRLDDAWQGAVDFMLAQGLWNFAIRTVELSADEDVDPRIGYEYAFSAPDDYIRVVAISETGTFDEGLADYEPENGYWYANSDPLYVRYVSDDEEYGWDIGNWPMPFTKTLEAYLAFECGLPIAADRGNRNDLFSLYKSRLKNAKSLDAIEERVKRAPAGRLVRSRFRYGSARDRDRA